MTRMFAEVTKRWNPVVGCEYGCSYCWARDLALGRLKHLLRYQDGFEPRLIPGELDKRFRGGLVFVSDMGDLFGQWVPKRWIERVIVAIKYSPDATFLMLTKNPIRYFDFVRQLPPNVILGVTMESNRDLGITKAPAPFWRFQYFLSLPWDRKMVSIEPILDFDPVFPRWIELIKPKFIYIGFDNHNKHLEEPALEKTRELIKALQGFTEVRIKTLREAWKGDLDV